MVRAMIVVDVQRDFCEGGSLAVAGGGTVAMSIANSIETYRSGGSKLFDYFVATKDFHAPDSSNGGHIVENPDYVDSWPAHCIAGTDGASFHPSMAVMADELDATFYKGYGRPDYSGFQGNTLEPFAGKGFIGEPTSLHAWLTDRKVTHVTIVGIATDHCVYRTALDAINLGYEVHVPYDLTVAVGGQDAVEKTIAKIRAYQKSRLTGSRF